METIIIVSVLSTLGSVAVLTSIVVAFMKLKHKVDGNSFEITINDIHRRMDDIERCTDDKIDRLITSVYESINHNQNQTSLEFEEIRRLIDSRCDKLDAKIKATSGNLIPKTDKQILND
jgi:tetrahydromethanopterin S-methyltransferase subunit G